MTLYSEDMAGVCVDSGHRLLIKGIVKLVSSQAQTQW